MIVLIIIGLIGTSAFMVISKLNKINKVSDLDDVISPESEDFETNTDDQSETDLVNTSPDEVDWSAVEPFLDDDLINILLIGQDRYDGQSRQRSDTMILCSINPDTKQVSLISFLRDLYVQIPGGYSDNRLNAAYAFGGFPLLTETLNKNFGITTDGCFEVDFSGFKNVINVLGGVDISLTAAEAEIVGGGVTEGMNPLDGEQALNYSRIRKIDSDFGRTQRQRNVLQIVFAKLKDSSATELWELLDEVLPLLSTDMTNGQIMQLATNLIPMLSSVELSEYCVPTSDEYYSASIRGMSVLVPDLDKIHQQLENEYLPLN